MSNVMRHGHSVESKYIFIHVVRRSLIPGSCLSAGIDCEGVDGQSKPKAQNKSKVGLAIADAIKASQKTSTSRHVKHRTWARPTKSRQSTAQISPVYRTHPSLVDVLGAGRYDPFDTFCVKNISKKTHQVLDLALSAQWSIYAPSQRENDQTVLKKEVMGYAIHSELPYFTTMFSSFCYYAFFVEHEEEQRESETIRLWLKQQITKRLVQAINASNGKVTDEILMGIIFLGSHGGGETLTRPGLSRLQQRKSMKKFQNLEYWCNMYTIEQHIDTFYRLIADVGGIHKAFGSNSALRAAAIMFDMFNSWRELIRPQFPLVAPSSYVIALRRWKPDDKTLETRTTLASGLTDIYKKMPDDPAARKLQDVISGMKVLILDYEQVDRTKTASPDLKPDQTLLLWIRGSVMHELLTLPDRRAEIHQEGVLVYELCRMSCLMFVQIEIMPMLGTRRNMSRRLVNMVAPFLAEADIRSGPMLNEECLWFLMMTLLLAFEDFDLTGEDESLELIRPFLTRALWQYASKEWKDLSAIMMRFLWRRPDCDITAKDAWEWARQRIYIDEGLYKGQSLSPEADSLAEHGGNDNWSPGIVGSTFDGEEATEAWFEETKAFSAEAELWKWAEANSPRP